MPKNSRDDLRNQLRRRELAPVYLLYGAETYLRDSAARTISDFSFSENDFRDFNDTRFSLTSDDSLAQAISAAEQLPMMAGRRVVRVTDIRISATGTRDTIREEHEQMLTSYLDNPSPQTTLIFVADELNGTRKMSKLLLQKSFAVEFAALSEFELIEWSRKEFTNLGAQVSDSAVRQLVNLVGSDVCRLSCEIKKLATAALPENVVTPELIDDLVLNARELSNFDLTDHLVAGRKTQAITALKKILDDGTDPLQLLGLISYNYRRLLMANDMMARGVDKREIANVVKLRFSDQEPFLAAARKVKTGALTSALERIAKTDLAIKTSIGGTGPQAARLQLEMLVCGLAVDQISRN